MSGEITQEFSIHIRVGDSTYPLSSHVLFEQNFTTRKFGAFDTWVLTVQSDKIITSPNCDFIPEAFIFEDAPIELMHDGRLGFIDRFQ